MRSPTQQRRQDTPAIKRMTACLAALIAAGMLAMAPTGTAAANGTPAQNGSELDFSVGNSVLQTKQTSQVAPGLDVTSFSKFDGDANRWVTGNVLVANTTEPTLSMDLVDTGNVAAVAPVSQQIANDPSVVAAVNSDTFDMNASNAPTHTNVSAEHGIRSISPDSPTAITVDANGAAAIQQLAGASTATFGNDPAKRPVASVNSPSVPGDALVYYTQAWGTWPLKNVLDAAHAGNVHAVWIKDGKVERAGVIDDLAANTALGDGEAILIGTGTQGDAVGALKAGDAAQVTVALNKDVKVAAGGRVVLMQDGAIVVPQDNDYKHARMVAGISQDGSRLYLLEVDGNQADSLGLTLYDAAAQLQAFGAWNAVELDGGGSATMIARKAGTTAPQIVNRPSDGNERSVTNALVFRSSASATQLADAQVAPAAAKASTRVLEGLTRTFAGSAVASNGAGIASAGTFGAQGDVTLESSDAATSTAVVRGTRHGAGTVSFATQGATASANVTVLGRLDHASASDSTVSLQSRDATATTVVTGFDADGYDALIEPRDITVSGGDGVVQAQAQPDGSFLLTPLVDSGAATLTYTIAGAGANGADVTVQQAVTVGLRSVPVLDFADADQWKADAARATGSLEPAEGHDAAAATGAKGLRLQYDFTQSTATRGYYAVLPADKVLDGQPQMLTLWIKGDGSGAWPRIQVVTGDGVTTNLNGPNIDWTGWKQVSFPVPAGTAYPLTLQRIRIMEIRSTASYHGDITLSDLEEVVAPDAQEPASTPVHDPVIATGSSDVTSRPLKVAVMSDAQFVARDPDGANVRHARETIRQIAAAKPDLMVIDGDFVDEGSEADLKFAKQVLDEEVPADLPYLYVPGNHEQMGDKDISVFEQVIGPANSHTDVRGTKVITLDSSSGTLHGQGVDQLKMLEGQLDAARDDASVTGVLVFTHMPIDDYLPSKNSQLGDRTEAARFAKALSDFRASTGKSIAIINGHVGGFNATAFDGVSQITNGNSGKGPASTPDNGGFIGWTMLGVNPSSGKVGSVETASPLARLNWMRAETRPQVDDGSLTVLGADGNPVDAITLQEGSSTDLRATFTQEDGTRTVPVQWPASFVWSGDGVGVDDGLGDAVEGGADGAAGSTAAIVDARTGRLTAVKAGDVNLTLTVNGQTRTVALHVTAKPTPSQPDQPGQPGGNGQQPGQPGGQPGTPGANGGNGGNGAGNNANGANGKGDGLASTGSDAVDIALAAILLIGAGAGVTITLRHRPR